MSETSKQMNRFIEDATKIEIEEILENIILTDHQKEVFEMKYIKRYDVNYIAYKTGYSISKVESDLRKIRKKFVKLI